MPYEQVDPIWIEIGELVVFNQRARAGKCGFEREGACVPKSAAKLEIVVAHRDVLLDERDVPVLLA